MLTRRRWIVLNREEAGNLLKMGKGSLSRRRGRRRRKVMPTSWQEETDSR